MEHDQQMLGSKKDQKASRVMVYTVSGYLLIAVGFLCLMSFFCYSLNEQLYEKRAFHLKQITEKIVQTIDAVLTAQWEHTVNISNQLSAMSIQSTDAMTLALRQMEKELALKNTCLLAFDAQKNYYSSSGFEGKWPLENPIPINPHKHQMLVTNIDGLCDDQQQMIFMRKLPQPIHVQESRPAITHLALVRGMQSFNDAFSISSFENTGSTYIIHPDGMRVYRNAFWQAPIFVYNIVDELTCVQFLHGTSIALLKEDLHARKSGSMEIRYKNENFFVSYAPMRSNDWSFMVFVPTNVAFSNSQRFMRSVVLNVAMIVLTVIALVSLTVYLLLSARSSKCLLSQQKTSNLALQQAVCDARKANEAKSDFLSHISHDVRTPIYGIIGMTEIAQKNLQDVSRISECLDKISTASDHLLMLVNDVLDMSKIEKGKIQIVHIPFDIETVLDNCISVISGQLAQRDILLERNDAHLKHVHLIGDALHLHQILLNILGNSVKFTPDGGRITLRVQETAYDDQTAWFHIQIEDTGIGMSEEFQRHLFEPFTQEESALYCNSSRTGLGMSIVKGLLDAMEGEIKVKSQIGQGSLFSIRLGFLIDQSAATISAPNSTQDLSGMRVLLVEDHPINREIAEYTLTEHRILVAHASNGQEALDLFAQSELGEFDVILMDICMPVMNGIESCRAIRQLDRPDAATIPIIAMSANAYVEDIQKALDSGMDDHLAKPIDLDQLFTVLMRYNPRKVSPK